MIPFLKKVEEEASSLSGDKLNEAIESKINSLFDEIHKEYFERKTINHEKNRTYLELNKCLWPDMTELINEFNNATEIEDEEFDDGLKKIVQEKQKVEEKPKMDPNELIKAIDAKIAELEEKSKKKIL